MDDVRTFEVFHSRLILRGKLVAESGLHLGAGGSLEPVGSDSPVLRDALGRPYIPGSSLKGVLRSTVERLIRGINPGRSGRVWSCDILQESCVNPQERKELKEKFEDDERFTQALIEKSCSVCRLFGSPWLASRALIKDLYCTAGWPGQIEVRDGVGIDRDTETAAPRIKYDYEVAPRGIAFDLELVVENAEGWDPGLLFVGLRELDQGRASLGGLTSRGLGRVRLDWREMELIGEGGADLLEYLATGRGKVLRPRPVQEAGDRAKEEEESLDPSGNPSSASPTPTADIEREKEKAFELLARVILILEQEGLPASFNNIVQRMENDYGFLPKEIGLPRLGKDFIPAAQKAGWVERAGKEEIVRLTEEGRSRLLPEEAEPSVDPPNEESEPEALEVKEKFIEDFIADKIVQLIQRIKGGEDHAQAAA